MLEHAEERKEQRREMERQREAPESYRQAGDGAKPKTRDDTFGSCLIRSELLVSFRQRMPREVTKGLRVRPRWKRSEETSPPRRLKAASAASSPHLLPSIAAFRG